MKIALVEVVAADLSRSLRSPICPACVSAKPAAKSVCCRCWQRLTPAMQRRLYHRIGQGYEQAFNLSMEMLNVTEITLPDQAKAAR